MDRWHLSNFEFYSIKSKMSVISYCYRLAWIFVSIIITSFVSLVLFHIILKYLWQNIHFWIVEIENFQCKTFFLFLNRTHFLQFVFTLFFLPLLLLFFFLFVCSFHFSSNFIYWLHSNTQHTHIDLILCHAIFSTCQHQFINRWFKIATTFHFLVAVGQHAE